MLTFTLICSVAKIAGLLVKTLAKPLSKRIKHEFSRYESTQRVLINIGQFTHTVTSRLTIWSAGYKVRSIKPLEDEKALSTGAEFVGESFILMVSVSVLLYEYSSAAEKSRMKEEKSKAAAKAERVDLQRKLHAIDLRLIAVEEFVKKQSTYAITAKYREPNQQEIVPLSSKSSGGADEEEGKLREIGNGGGSRGAKSTVAHAPRPTEPPTSSLPWWRRLWPPW